ncbi:AbiV family abortive infection protein [Streptomyces sp. NPDC058475]|uniref:AbiV family abortive infection protein n=1 Tax=Streptomyces sp. NPDC058475 TaxID=3346518 RepID=UPI003654350D
MKPRDLVAVLNVPKAERLALIAEGLELLAEHVSTLRDDLIHLQEAGRSRGAAVIDGLASEEAAKMLILLDVVRMGWSDTVAVRGQLRNFYNHLARGIYARLIAGRPADLAEVRRYAESLRRELYLDGPNDVDWIFRNSVEADREESLYVDYVTSEGDSAWITPARLSDLKLSSWPSMVVDLALALHRLGCTSEKGLEIIAKEWDGFSLDDDTHWVNVEAINKRILNKLHAAGLFSDDLTQANMRLALEQWIFPLGGVDLSPIKVTKTELLAERERWVARQ